MNDQALQVLKTRRSVRKFKREQITEAELNAVLEAGMYAPSGKGLQAAIIIVVQDQPTIEKLAKMNAAILGADTNPYYGAPTILLVLADSGVSTWVEDGSCVMANLMNAAHAVGLGSCWVHREREMFDSAEGKALLKQWGVAGGYAGVGACILGYADGPVAAAKARKPGYVIKV